MCSSGEVQMSGITFSPDAEPRNGTWLSDLIEALSATAVSVLRSYVPRGLGEPQWAPFSCPTVPVDLAYPSWAVSTPAHDPTWGYRTAIDVRR